MVSLNLPGEARDVITRSSAMTLKWGLYTVLGRLSQETDAKTLKVLEDLNQKFAGDEKLENLLGASLLARIAAYMASYAAMKLQNRKDSKNAGVRAAAVAVPAASVEVEEEEESSAPSKRKPAGGGGGKGAKRSRLEMTGGRL